MHTKDSLSRHWFKMPFEDLCDRRKNTIKQFLETEKKKELVKADNRP